MTESQSPIQNGHVAEAIAKHFLGADAKWIGGRNPGHDILLAGSKIDVKSGVRQRNVLTAGHSAVTTIGIRLNKGTDGLPKQDVDEILVVVRDGYSRSTVEVIMDKTTAQVEMKVDVDKVAVYRLPVADAMQLFKRPFTKTGAQRKSIKNVDAAVSDLEGFRIEPSGTA